MKLEVKQVVLEIGKVIEIKQNCPMWKIGKVMKEGFCKIYTKLKTNNIKINSNKTAYSRYINVNWDEQMNKGFLAKIMMMFEKWEFYMGIQIEKKVDFGDEFKLNSIKKQKYLETIHTGSYYKLGRTYHKLYYWAKENKKKLGNSSIEFYLNDPKYTKSDELKTRILVSVV